MSLRTKVVTLLLILFAGYAAVDFALQRLVIYPGFVELEREEARKNVDRAVQALQRELDLLGPSVKDWGTWDDSYQFVQDRNQAYIDTNLNDQALEGLAVNALAFYDGQGDLVWGQGYDLGTGEVMPMPGLLPSRLADDHPLRRILSGGSEAAGIVREPQGPVLVAARPVLTSAGEGPPKGLVLMARVLDAEAIARLGAQARVDLRVSTARVAEGPLPAETPPEKIAHTGIQLAEGETSTLGETTLLGLDGAPALRLAVATPREISARGDQALRFATISMALAGGLVLLVMLVTMRRLVLDPISELTSQAVLVGSRQDLSVRLNSGRRDEIGLLAREFDRMVQRLAEARALLVEQSYKSGVAEMASGVLHNIGNALTPLGVKLGGLKAALAGAPVEEVGLAAAELSAPVLDPGRRRDMQAFLALAGTELADLVRRTAGDLEGIQASVDHIQQILADQHRLSRAERVIEPVPLAPLVREALGVLPEPLSRSVEIQLAPELDRVGPVRAARVALQQVVGNLVLNAAEAIAALGERARPGAIHVSAEETVIEGQPMVHLRVADEGVGIRAEDLPRIFARGYSTKSRGSGLGLHWSANTIQLLGGRLFAESEGPGQGACLHLLLPQAVAPIESLQEAA